MTYTKDSLIQVQNISYAYPVCVQFDINHTRMDEKYYSRNFKIDESNRTRHDDFQLQSKLQTKDWIIKAYTSILGMDGVDTYYLGKACDWWDDRNPAKLYYNLTEDIIDNRLTEIR